MGETTRIWMDDQDGLIIVGDVLDGLAHLDDSSVEAIVCDPPYDLLQASRKGSGRSNNPDSPAGRHGTKTGGFMGMAWDATGVAFDPKTWEACLRVLKPGGHMVVFGGTRTHHRMWVAIEDAGFEVRDMLTWLYGCLSEDTEILVDGRWEPYHKAIAGHHALCYNVDDDTYSWQPIEDSFVYDYADTAYRIVSDHTDQIVSRNHRCLVERDGVYVFQTAETLALECAARVPILEGVQSLLHHLSLPNEGVGGEESVLLSELRRSSAAQEEAVGSTQRAVDSLCRVRQKGVEARRLVAKDQNADMFVSMQWQISGEGLGQTRAQGASSLDNRVHGILSGKDDWREQPCVEGRGNLFPQTRQLQANQVRPLSGTIFADGSQGWVRDGTSAAGRSGNGSLSGACGVSASHRPRSAEQRSGKPDAVQDEPGSQTVRASRYTRSDLATIEPIAYRGKVWCVKVPTGAFVARRNGKVFVTGNSGFPKSLDVSKAIDKAGGGDRAHMAARKELAKAIRAARERADVSRAELAKWFPQYSDVTANWERLDVGFRIPSESAYNQLVERLGLADGWREMVRAEDKRHQIVGVSANRQADGTVLSLGHDGSRFEATTDAAKQWEGYGTALKPAVEPILLARKPLSEPTVAANVLKWGTGALAIDATRIGTDDTLSIGSGDMGYHGADKSNPGRQHPGGRWPANVIFECACDDPQPLPEKARKRKNEPSQEQRYTEEGATNFAAKPGTRREGGGFVHQPDCPAGMLDAQTGTRTSGKPGKRGAPTNLVYGEESRPEGDPMVGYGDSGGASRFFYCSKASRKERGEANKHPTVKPIALMRWLIRLVTPPDGIVLDPFCGSGSTLVAAVEEGHGFVGIDLSPEYCATAQHRVEGAGRG